MDFELRPRISISEKDFFPKLGDNWVDMKNKIHIEIVKKNDYRCGGCGYKVQEHNAIKILQPHLIQENEEDLLSSEFIPLCKACHTTQHIDRAISEGWVNIVNSSFSQKSLIEMSRINSVVNYISNKEIRILKMSPIDFVEHLKNDTLPLHSRIKVIFTNKFEWGDL